MDSEAAPLPAAQPAPPLSRAARRRLALSFWGLASLCLLLLAALFLLSRTIPNGRVDTGPHELLVENGLGQAICAIHIGEAPPQTSFSRNKLGTTALQTGEGFRLFGLQPEPYALRAWTCDGRQTRVVTRDPAAGEAGWLIQPADILLP